MILLFDVGNTSIYSGIVERHTITSTFRMNTDVTKTPDEYYVIMKSLIDVREVEAIAIASVVPAITLILKKIAIKYFNIDPFILEPGVRTGILLKTDNPKEVGADLICDAAGLTSPNATLIVDLGTANKLIYVKNKTVLGVSIAPGIQLAMKALAGGTALLHEIDLVAPKKVLGTNTIASMQSGIIYGTAAFIDGMIERIKQEVDESFDVILTGGLSRMMSEHIKTPLVRESRLVLHGLYHIYQKNIT